MTTTQPAAADALPANILDAASFTKPLEPKLLFEILTRDERKQIPVASIDESPFNPRKAFEGIEDLAQSIQAQGLLEDLVVRPSPKKAGRFELIAGARRLRALKLIKAVDVWVKVKKATDGEAKAAQIVENLQRENVKPLEEAEGFKALQAEDPKRWTVQAIAQAVGKTPRFVQQRLAIATNLAPDLKKQLGAGKISVEVARTLAPLPASLQQKIEKDVGVRDNDPDRVRNAITRLAIPLAKAKFDPALYTGDKLEQGKTTYCLNLDQFRQLQAVEARKVVEKLKAEWPDARLVGDPKAWHWADDQWGHETVGSDWSNKTEPSKYLVAKDKCTAIVWVAASGEIKVAKGVCSGAAVTAARTARDKKRQAKGAATGMGYGGSRGEKADHKKAREAYNAAVVAAIAKKGDVGHRWALFNNVTSDNHSGGLSPNDYKKLLPSSIAKFRSSWYFDDRESVALWQAIVKLPLVQVTATLRKLALAAAPSWHPTEFNELPLLMNAVAATLGVTPPAIALPPAPKPKADKPKANAKAKAKAKTKAKTRKHQ